MGSELNWDRWHVVARSVMLEMDSEGRVHIPANVRRVVKARGFTPAREKYKGLLKVAMVGAGSRTNGYRRPTLSPLPQNDRRLASEIRYIFASLSRSVLSSRRTFSMASLNSSSVISSETIFFSTMMPILSQPRLNLFLSTFPGLSGSICHRPNEQEECRPHLILP